MFKTKISQSNLDNNHVVIKYTTNGLFWKAVRNCSYDPIKEKCVMETTTVHFRDAEKALSAFKTIEDINRYEQIEKQRADNINLQKKEADLKQKADKKAIYKRFA